MFTQQDLQQIEKHGLTPEAVELQLENFRRGFPFLNVVRAASPGDGVLTLSDAEAAAAAERYERAAAGLRLGGEPASLSGDSASPLPAAASAVYLAHFAVVNELLRKLRRVGEAVVSHDHERLARSVRGVIHLHDLFDIDSVRLLAENVLARLESGNRDYRVEIVRGADIDRVYRLVLEQLVEIGIYLRVGEKTVAALDRPLLDYVAECDNLKAIVFKIVLAVSAVEYSADTDKGGCLTKIDIVSVDDKTGEMTANVTWIRGKHSNHAASAAFQSVTDDSDVSLDATVKGTLYSAPTEQGKHRVTATLTGTASNGKPMVVGIYAGGDQYSDDWTIF